MKTLLIVIAVIVIVCIIMFYASSDRLAKDVSRPSDDKKPTVEKVNDKIILIDNANLKDVRQALTAFCNLYNKDDFAALPRLWELSPTSFAVTFPYDVDFTIFCFAVNYLDYPIDIKWQANVRGWATTRVGDDWITTENANKHTMFFLATDDTEHDNVFVTTADNVGYKLPFSTTKAQVLAMPSQLYQAPPIKPNTLSGQKHEDFK